MNISEKYEQEIILVMERYLNEDSVCVDIGAHEGAVLQEMERLAPVAVHWAFEAIPNLIKNLEHKFKRSKVYGCALSDQQGLADFYYVRNDHAYSGLRQRSYDIPDPEIEKIKVHVNLLDEVIDPVVDVSLIKIDIEGGEYHAMLGARETICRCRPVIIFEASDRSCGHYDVTADMIYQLVTTDFNMKISTMADWLNNRSALSKQAFIKIYNNEYYFIAYPFTSVT